MYFKFIHDSSLAQNSYIIGCQAEGVAAVIDPKRDIDTYLDIAEDNGLTITHILETHIHADFLCGSRELAQATGAQMYLSDEGGADAAYAFPHQPLKNGSVMRLGNIAVEVLHTPGHTPEALSFLVTDESATREPVMLFTGDFFFVGDVGRPDLPDKLTGTTHTATHGAKDQHASVQKLLQLNDHLQIWPGHGAGSSCGKALGAVPMTTLGYEKHRNWALQLSEDQDEFIRELLSGQPEPPKYFLEMKKLNSVKNRNILTDIPKPRQLTRKEFARARKDKLPLIDARPWEKYIKGHLKEVWNITNDDSFATEIGWLMDYERPFVIIAGKKQWNDITRKLMRIGMDNVLGFVTPKQLKTWEPKNQITARIVNKKALQEALHDKTVQLIDVRNRSEYDEGHIGHAQNIHYGMLDGHLSEIDKEKRLILYCRTGGRAAVAYSFLLSQGFDKVSIYPGGWEEWNHAQAVD